MKNLDLMNQAYLMKVGWGLINSKDDLWAKVMKAKYKCGNDLIPNVQSCLSASNLWNGVVKTWDKVEKHIFWRVGNGDSVAFWKDVWIYEVGLPPPSRNLGDDTIRWALTKDGKFSIKTAYQALFGNHPCNAQLINPKYWDNFFGKDMNEWVGWNWRINIGKANLGDWRTTFGVAFWSAWRHRNEVSFNNKNLNQNDLFFSILSRCREYSGCSRPQWEGNNRRQRKLELVVWIQPKDELLKCNVDGSVHENGQAACGGVIKNAVGDYVSGFSGNLGTCSITVAELFAIMEGLTLAWNTGYRKVILEADSRVALDLISQNIIDLHPYYNLIQTFKTCAIEIGVLFSSTLTERATGWLISWLIGVTLSGMA
ncbi:putative ribonuclease H protein At1g65750 family [Senna tora]|uniref:Putative ribonuclease H protein At1g65750 family n=1 Tax=Senna tora TaxID=362788 RepID=A0A834WVB6_9FABA|nr:putative ribonuclease H protein At1g65750 family [Senna tora]